MSNSTKLANPMKVITGKDTRWSYANVWEAKSIKLRYSPSTDFLVYNGRFWEESKPKAQAVAQELTTRQLEEAETEIKKATDEMMKTAHGSCWHRWGQRKRLWLSARNRLVLSKSTRTPRPTATMPSSAEIPNTSPLP